MAESIITHYCLGTGELKCIGCQQEKNWQAMNELPDSWRKTAQEQAQRIDDADCILMGRPWYVIAAEQEPYKWPNP